MLDAFVGLGANLGDPEASLRTAVARLSRVLEIGAISSLYRTEPVGPVAQPDFLNAVVRGTTTRPPHELLALLREIEDDAGRERSVPMAPRTLDLDLLLYGSVVLDEPGLTVPHPRMAGRRFVLAPLVELDPHVVHPVSGRTARELLDRLSAGEVAERLSVAGWPPAWEPR
jgi:2-amino-4-hydroxy-6-hydroxymethyldihydropteridine diphosphokinase